MVRALFTDTKGVDGCPDIPWVTTSSVTEFDLCAKGQSKYGEKCILQNHATGNYCKPIKTHRRSAGDQARTIVTTCNQAGHTPNSNAWDNGDLIEDVGAAKWCDQWTEGLKSGSRTEQDENLNRMQPGEKCVPTSLPTAVECWNNAGGCCKRVRTCKRVNENGDVHEPKLYAQDDCARLV